MSEKIIKSVRIRERWGSINVYNNNGSPIYKWSEKGFDTKISLFKSGTSGKKRVVRAYDEGGAERGSGDPQKGDRFSSKNLKLWNPIEYTTDGSDLDFKYGQYGDDAFIFQYITTQAAIIRREKYYDGTTWKPGPYTSSELPDSILSEWISIKDVNNNSEDYNVYSPSYFGLSLNETDVKYRKKFGYKPPYFEIIQDPFIEAKDELSKKKLLLRNFGQDRYYLNNGSSVWIEWSQVDDHKTPFKDGTMISGTEHSDNWGRELDIYDINKFPEMNSIIGSTKQLIKKRATIYGPNNEKFCLSSEITDKKIIDVPETEDWNKIRKDIGFLSERELDGIKYESKIWDYNISRELAGLPKKNVDKSLYNNGIYDEEILNEILEKWRQVYGNQKLELINIYGTPSTSIEFLLPIQSNIVTTTGSSGSTGSSASSVLITSSASGVIGASGATGASASKPKRVTGSYIFDVTRSNYLINSELGELLIIEKETIEDPFVLPFQESEEDLQELSSEYTENAYSGSEEDLIEDEHSDDAWSEEKAKEDAEVLKKIEGSSTETSPSGQTTLSNEPVTVGKWSFDPIPGEFVTNSGIKIKCVVIDGAPVNITIAGKFLDMQTAAKKDGIDLSVNSGFRSPYDSINASAPSGYSNGVKVNKKCNASASSQDSLYKAYLAGKGNLAAKPGASNHGNGIGLDINAGGKSKGRYIDVNEKRYEWLVKNSWKFGFVRTVAKEEWHYDYRPDIAAKGPYAALPAKDKGLVDTKFYNKKKNGSPWGLDELKV
jgi:hypothetical protein